MKDNGSRLRDAEIEISKLAKSIRENIESIENLEAQVPGPGVLDGVQEAIANNAENIAWLQTAVAENAHNISTIESAVGENAESISSLQTAASKHAEDISSLENAVAENTQAVAENAQAIEELKANNAGGADTSALEAQVAELETNIEGMQTTLNTLQSATQVNATNIAENSAKIATMLESNRVVADALNRIAELEKLHGLAQEVWGTRGTTVEEISALMDDYTTESNFCTETTTHLQFGTFGENGPHARIFFRQNPLRTTNPQVVLKFSFSNLPTDIDSLPCHITLNGVSIFSDDLAVDLSATEFQSVATLEINPSQHNIVMFNEIVVAFDSEDLVDTILDFVEVQISNSQNCIVLNRANHVNIYGWVNKAAGTKRLVCSKYYKGQGFKTFMVTGTTDLMSVENTKTSFPASTAGGYPVVWASRYLQENWNSSSGRFTTTIDYQLDYYINSQNTLFVLNNMKQPSTLTATYPHVDNVLYAKKSLHNDIEEVEAVLVVHNDFSVKRYQGHYYTSLSPTFLYQQNFSLAGITYPSEFVDFIPVHDYTTGASKTSIQYVGYFLLHKSGNILFVPQRISPFYIKIGKGRQVTASYHTDFMGIDIFYECNGVIYKKVLTRQEANSVDWALSDIVETIENSDYVFDNDIYRFHVKKGEITQVIKT